MATPPRSPGSDEASFDSARPFKGMVVCCTSIPPELRTDIAGKTAELGGTHKYDLTPDCTHLIVGEYATPKYRHVAKERPDVKVMGAGWVEAVRNLWVADVEIDFVALENEWQLRTFEISGGEPLPDGTEAERPRLLCCMTGFDDPDVRQEIMDRIESNGGRYTGDLTRHVTHLIVCKPEGRKYQAAKNWDIHTVTIEWVNDSAERGLILDEKCYDPTIPQAQRGVGAWNRKAMTRQVSTGKRLRDGSTAGQDEGRRKLRKTASMKLNSQRDNLWGDILGKQQTAEPSAPFVEAVPARPTPSAEVKLNISQLQSAGNKSLDTQGTKLSSFGVSDDGLVFASCGFYVHGFSSQRTSVLVGAISSLGGSVCNSLEEVASASGAQFAYRFLVVPQESAPQSHPLLPEGVEITTEFYIERCMHKKYFFNPTEHVIGRPFPGFPISGFERFTICTAGFTGVDLHQVNKVTQQLGAKYEEKFTKSISLLVCTSLRVVRPKKLELALAWKVPVVSADWLWECISSCYNVPIKRFRFSDSEVRHIALGEADGFDQGKGKGKQDKSAWDGVDKDLLPKPAKPKGTHEIDFSGMFAPIKGGSKISKAKKSTATDGHPALATERDSFTTETSHFETALTHQAPTINPFSDGSSGNDSGGKSIIASAPLSEATPNALNQASPSPQKPTAKPQPRKPLGRVASEIADSEAADSEITPSGNPPAVPGAPPQDSPSTRRKRVAAEKAARVAAERDALSSKLATSLLDSAAIPPDTTAVEPAEAEADPLGSTTKAGGTRRRKRQILGRAVSNVSAASSASGGGGGIDSSGGWKDEGQPPPAPTQLEYDDPEAKRHKAELMHKMMGGKNGLSKAASFSAGYGVTGARQEKLTLSELGGYDMQAQTRGPGGERRSKRR
ncbi:BRCT domain-containing protein [Lasiosphaeris hirsuta]|uniref:BRCT domain-containing protein n=1 Tax=Lasiosphaeris hirsuta TaxID=260670 RepID=A0AA39ZVR7_9PEZI|nr:BRCT domain-containing protein [Lasiosphaeris hirsuta]